MNKLIVLIFIFTHSLLSNDIVVSIKPLHSLIQSVLGDTQKARLLLNNNQSPHGFSLKPSHIRMLNNAKVVFYIDNSFETFLNKAFNNMPKHIKKISAIKFDNIKLLKMRKNGNWDEHLDKHSHSQHNKLDFHIWLDTNNAKLIVNHIAKILSNTYPKNRKIYKNNAKIMISKIQKLENKISNSRLKSIRKHPYIVFHDAYQYFEKQYKLNAVGSIVISPSITPSIKQIRKIRKKLKRENIKCIFKEPQFNSKIINIIKANSHIKIHTIDPIGLSIKPSKDLYINLIEDIANNITSCLAEVEL